MTDFPEISNKYWTRKKVNFGFNNISWDPVENAVQYSVYRSSSEGDPATTGKIAVIGDTNLEDTGLAAEGDEPTENTAFDHYGKSGDYDFVTL